MTDEMLIREIAQIKALQSVTLHMLRLAIESVGEAYGKEMDVKAKTQNLLTALEVEYENHLRDDLQLPRRPVLHDRASFEDFADWPEVFDSEDTQDDSAAD